MLSFLCKRFIPNYEDTDNSLVREKYGTVISYFSILCNILLVIIKLIISFVTNSISIRADALNNLSDVGSNIATLFGFKLSNKHADKDHPYGHGRMEYISGMIVSFLIVSMGFSALKEAALKIFNKHDLLFSYVAIVILVISIFIKLLMYSVNKKAGEKINSETLLAAAQDSLNDSLMTLATLVSLLIVKFLKINLDAYIGLIVSIFVLKSGYEIFKNVMDTILGRAPDRELIKRIENAIMEHKEIHGIHDLMLHDYGLSRRFLTLHAEVDSNDDVIKTHDAIDNVERQIFEEFGITTTIHMDPIDFKDQEAQKLKLKVMDAVKKINKEYNIHDFRVVRGPTHTNLVFDCLIPADERLSHVEIANMIQREVDKFPDGPYYCVIEVEHSYV